MNNNNPFYPNTSRPYASTSSANADANPYYQPYAGPQYPTPGAAGSSSTHHAPVPANAYEYDVGILAQQSVYVPGAMIDKRGGAGGKVAKGGKRTTVLRKGAGKVWEDQTLLEWDSSWFRLFVGDLSNDVSDDVLANAFNKYPSFTKARVIRDQLSQKAKYGFVAFSDPEDFLKAWKEMDGKYVGNRPVKLKKADNNIRPVEIGHRKARQLEKELKKNRKSKPY
ncbi:RNA-binding domain-containing protein [Fomitiporia mediterranea MF3/22]|uniref:RNA-binding domain-containing protein n=1 Tax=Fomitiporia mediterranea (strain MF3/22) TaxID=694068 RepID=UPI0004408C1B|nr:RNA-binding domain-containing protein [Fomitiporia mediterranea MF3/22]EJD01452.1 RNA-binding domain-containing protein [Fomitiporia mediterranea MF3/22]